MKSRDSENIALAVLKENIRFVLNGEIEDKAAGSFCLLSNQTDHRKNTGGGYRNAFCFIETVGLFENGSYEEGEWSGMLETANQRWFIYTFKGNLYILYILVGVAGYFLINLFPTLFPMCYNDFGWE